LDWINDETTANLHPRIDPRRDIANRQQLADARNKNKPKPNAKPLLEFVVLVYFRALRGQDLVPK
jgi:hypothetical protein